MVYAHIFMYTYIYIYIHMFLASYMDLRGLEISALKPIETQVLRSVETAAHWRQVLKLHDVSGHERVRV